MQCLSSNLLCCLLSPRSQISGRLDAFHSVLANHGARLLEGWVFAQVVCVCVCLIRLAWWCRIRLIDMYIIIRRYIYILYIYSYIHVSWSSMHIKILPVAEHDSTDDTQGERWRSMEYPHLLNRRRSEVESNSRCNEIWWVTFWLTKSSLTINAGEAHLQAGLEAGFEFLFQWHKIDNTKRYINQTCIQYYVYLNVLYMLFICTYSFTPVWEFEPSPVHLT